MERNIEELTANYTRVREQLSFYEGELSALQTHERLGKEFENFGILNQTYFFFFFFFSFQKHHEIKKGSFLYAFSFSINSSVFEL